MDSRNAPLLVTVPAGEWQVGGDLRRPDASPTRLVLLEAFRVAIAPVTNAEFLRFREATGHASLPFDDDETLSVPAQPAVGVSWFDAVAFLEWLTAELGLPCRLPSEEEREVAARGGLRGEPWPWGSKEPEDLPHLAYIANRRQPHAPSPACANGYGLQCMADNVHEWCADLHSLEADLSDVGARRASRGGSWRHHRKFTPVAARSSLPPDRRYSDYGFRVYADA